MNRISKIKNYYKWGGRFINDPFNIATKKLNDIESSKSPFRYDVINFLLSSLNRENTYLEIGVRNPVDNFNKINAAIKYSVDPGLEFKENPVDFVLTSDQFFDQIREDKILNKDIRFDVVFIDGLHLADQVDRDILNALEFLKEDGFIVLHDCNPPSEWHAREAHKYEISPAMQNWNGTTWKGFMKWRNNASVYSCTIDTDWGVGIISKSKKIGSSTSVQNPFFEFHVLDQNRKEALNLISFEDFKKMF